MNDIIAICLTVWVILAVAGVAIHLTSLYDRHDESDDDNDIW